MTINTITATISGLPPFPDGWGEPEWRKPKRGEGFLHYNEWHIATFDFYEDFKIVLRRVWQPPAWIKDGWIYPNNPACWFWTDKEPIPTVMVKGFYMSSSNKFWRISEEFADFNPPPELRPYRIERK